MRRKASRLFAWPVRIFATCWLVYSVYWTPYIVREHYPALTLARHGTLNVEKYVGWTADIFKGPEGGAYINNNPGASLAGALPLLPLRPLLRSLENAGPWLDPAVRPQIESGFLRRAAATGQGWFFLVVAFATVAGCMAPVSAFSAAFLGMRVFQAGFSYRSAAAVALLYAFGTPVFFRTAYLNHNLLVCHAGLIAFLLLWQPSGHPPATRHAFLAGLLSGFAVLCDFSGLVVLATVALYVVLVAPRSNRGIFLALYAAGAAPGLAALVLYQFAAFGNFLRPSQHYMSPTAPTVQGYKGFTWPSPALLWANFFDPRFGLFMACPLLLLAFASPFVRHVRYLVPARETFIIWVYFGLFVLFCAANQYSWLQPSTGFRYLVPVVPGLLLLSLQTLQALPRRMRIGIVSVAWLQGWATAATYANNPVDVLRRVFEGDLELRWIERMRVLGLLHHGWQVFVVVHLLLAVLILAIWRPRAVSS